MATQSIPAYGQLNKTITTLVPNRAIAVRRPLTSSSVRPMVRRDGREFSERQQALVGMLPMVRHTAFQVREHLPAHVEVDELFANGVMGLVDAVTKFDASKRVKLESYARHRVRGAILDGLRSADPASRDLRRKSKSIQKLYRDLETKLGRPVKDEEIASALGMDLAQWHRTLNEIQSVGFEFSARTLSAGPTSKRSSVETALLADDHADPFDLCYRREQGEILTRALSHLRQREREIVTLYYEEELTMKQIADRLNVDESRVSQLHTSALVRLKATVKSLLYPQEARIRALTPLAPMEVALAA